MPDRLRFTGTWRHYQELALDAFDRDVAAGRTRTHIIAPPGSGKTVLGLEMIARLGQPAVVLAPTATIQAQWPRALQAFAHPDGTNALAGTEPGARITCLTYQAICRVDDPDDALRALAAERWVAERAVATAAEPAAVATETATWTGEAARRRDREQTRILAGLKRAVARGEHPELELADLLAAGAQERIAALQAAGVRTVVLDECHHLSGLWGYLIRAVVAALGDVHLVGLTATPPDELTEDEHDLYDELLGPVDFFVPTPAVVKDGFLAPYQELAWLTEPLVSERAWLAEHDVRFAELVTALHDDTESPLSFPAWVIHRMRERGREDGDAEIPWERFQRRRPALARAGVRFLASAGMSLPAGAPRGEAYARQPDLDDWLVLLEDYAMRRLAPDPSPEAASRYDAIAAALRELGFQLTRRGLRRGASEVDRLLTSSAAKPLALVEVLGAESDARGPDLRALVLCDSERASRRADDALAGVLDPGAGTAARAVAALADDLRTAPLRPLLVSGRGLRCVTGDADALLAALAAAAPELTGWRAEPGEDELMRLLADGAGWTSRRWVALATGLLHDGVTQAIVGTRGLLGEGWDAPTVNCLVDLTVATTGVSVRQMRGRSLRLDPERPEKIASNWDVVCVAPGLARGEADYRRFVRRHAHLLAPAEDGAIEAGPSHVHPALGPFGPPPADEFAEINAACAGRAADHDAARERWAIGEPYEAVEVATAVVRPRRRAAGPERPALTQAPRYAGAGWTNWSAGWRPAHARSLFPVVPPLDLVARALADAYVALGELRPEAAASLDLEPRTTGHVRCALTAATPEEAGRFARALEQTLSPVEAPRYLVSRAVAIPGLGRVAAVGRALTGRPTLDTVWHAVPDDLGSHKKRAEALHAAWTRWLGPSRLAFTQRDDVGRRALATAAAQETEFETVVRDVWR
ncbi:MAG: DEAD/DEAH box helicase family protein [Solirubrobacteraceae bacterium]|nr:DEAD/DEAH box helicase family protein [Solirubrobacteraceae bacterium]